MDETVVCVIVITVCVACYGMHCRAMDTIESLLGREEDEDETADDRP